MPPPGCCVVVVDSAVVRTIKRAVAAASAAAAAGDNEQQAQHIHAAAAGSCDVARRSIFSYFFLSVYKRQLLHGKATLLSQQLSRFCVFIYFRKTLLVGVHKMVY